MSKRRRTGDTLTGGTGDVSPNLMSFAASQSGTDTTTTTTQAIPVQRLPQGGKAQVMEVLKVLFASNTAPTEVDNYLQVFLSTASFGTTATTFSEPRVFAAYERYINITTSGEFVFSEPFQLDLTDGAGHGILIATDNIYAQVVSGATGVTNRINIKIIYRWKNVPLAEYVGIVQSQQ